MKAWISRWFRREEPATHGWIVRTPIAPYEVLVDDGPPFGMRLHRPVVHAFEHTVLPGAVFSSHPQLQKALQRHATSGESFSFMWSKTAVVCESQGVWRPDSIDAEENFWKYARNLAATVSCIPTQRHGTTVWTIQTPPPQAPGETYLVAISKSDDDEWSYPQAPRSARFFTLEATLLAGSACFCEWTREGEHSNFGVSPIEASADFTSRVFSLIGAGA